MCVNPNVAKVEGEAAVGFAKLLPTKDMRYPRLVKSQF
jgi:hypothetical protein